MTPRPRLLAFLSRALLQGAALLLIAACAVPAAPPAQATDAADPPGRVGKLSLLSGPVTLVDIRSGEEQDASLNWPLTSGQRLSTGRLARAEVRIGSLALRLDDETDVDFARIDDEMVQLVVLRGTATVRVRNREMLRELDLLTPRERIVLDDVGRYRVDVDRAAGLTAVTALVGYARIAAGNNFTFTVQSGQRGEVSSIPTVGFVLVAPASDSFDDWVAQRDRRDDSIASARYVSPEMTGIEALDEHGSWRTVPDYGPVWYPSYVPSGWAPYRYGRWSYVAPWGWTWIDDAPWGFAPFHYGRWALVGGAWCWVPGTYVARPVFAPALVAWYGAPGVSVGVSVGNNVGWFPLGPGEVYVPPFRHSRRYISSINVSHVHNITVINNPPRRYVHQTPRTSTWAPDDAVARARPIQRVVRTPDVDVSRLPAAVAPPPSLGNRRPPPSNRVAPAPRGIETWPGGRPPKVDARERAIEAPVAQPGLPAGRMPPRGNDGRDDDRRDARPGGRPQAAVPVQPPTDAATRPDTGDAVRPPRSRWEGEASPPRAPRAMPPVAQPVPQPAVPRAMPEPPRAQEQGRAMPAPRFERSEPAPMPRAVPMPPKVEHAQPAPVPRIDRPEPVAPPRVAPPMRQAQPPGNEAGRGDGRNEGRNEGPRNDAPRGRLPQRD